MKNKKKVLIGIVASVALVTVVGVGVGSHFLASADYTNDYNRTFGEFTAKTASELLAEKQKNTCYSPVSLFAALSLSAEVTDGSTQKQIVKGLGVSSISELEEYYNQMLSEIEVESEGSNITLANSFWIDKVMVSDSVDKNVSKMEEKLNCEFFSVDKVSPFEVNAWVSKKTNGLINKMLDDNEEKSLLLANSVYYKSKWKFEIKQMTEKQNFYLEDNSEIKTDFLSAKEISLSYKINNDYIYVEMPLEEGKAVIIMPNEGEKL